MYIPSKMWKKRKKWFLSYDLPDSADRSVSRRRYYWNSREIMGLQEKNKYSNLVLRTSKIVDFRNLPEIVYRNSRILPYITVRDRGGTAIYTSCVSSSGGRCGLCLDKVLTLTYPSLQPPHNAVNKSTSKSKWHINSNSQLYIIHKWHGMYI